jgi:hypothetical protein
MSYVTFRKIDFTRTAYVRQKMRHFSQRLGRRP